MIGVLFIHPNCRFQFTCLNSNKSGSGSDQLVFKVIEQDRKTQTLFAVTG